MRIFIALELSEAFHDNLLNYINTLKMKYPRFRWVPPQNLHITLVFLGETDPVFLPDIKKTVDAVSGGGIIQARTGRLLLLPNRRNANVLAIGLDQGSDKMSELSQKILKNPEMRGIFVNNGHKPGKGNGFLAHVTLARKGRTELILDDVDLFPPAINGDIEKLTVFESVLSRQGAEYNVLASYKL